MPEITWNTNVDAPCCPGEILGPNGQSHLVQTDYDYPGVAGSFGWSVRNVQKCPECGSTVCDPIPDWRGGKRAECQSCGEAFDPCDHDHTDGTVDCPDCRAAASDFIEAAGEWLREHDGMTADDPGYFLEEANR